ncbi:toll/interleukin-1 receptor domain-containing protein [Thiothrix lacustris]|uniref:toll/interleukin-1 receptor domain-containing protein n=1 Tax=Thiothrix lacustris TaxID=525917 RepID=UPI0027E58E2E|nr:toll/interleukin-1 receptor domain-containing protein [Thiothrix lacustris]WMP17931.1 toll/interleukin-1 receptor domain-containing protein [Thiothrix lacustris]
MDETAVNIHAFVSYRHNRPPDIQTRDKLEELCAGKSISLIYDEKVTSEGDSLITFMEDLTAARCVFLFLSAAYFQSAYTLYELVSIHEQPDLDRHFVHPVRVTADMVTYQRTAMETYWQEHEAVRNELSRLLKQPDHALVWQRVVVAWDALVFPFLDTLQPALEEGDADAILQKRVGDMQQSVKVAIAETTKRLHEKVKSEIGRILGNQYIPGNKLKRELRLDPSIETQAIAQRLAEEPDVGQAIAVITRVVQTQAKLLAAKPEQWDECLSDAEQLCGWLLINSVDPVWWFHNELKMQRAARGGISHAFSLGDPAYIEVIISRSILQAARYDLNEYGKAKPVAENHDGTLLFDATEDATDELLLARLYKRLHRSPRVPSQVAELLEGIYSRAYSFYRTGQGKPVYYLVTQEQLELLESRSWFAEAQKKLAGYLQFICCDLQCQPYEQPACREDQTLLLDQVALLLSLRNGEENSYA